MICKFCGNSIEDNSDFCFICGQKVDPQEAPAPSNDIFSQAAAAPVAPTAPAPDPSYDPAYIPVAPAQVPLEPVYAQENEAVAPSYDPAYVPEYVYNGITTEEFKSFKKQYKSDMKTAKKEKKALKKEAKKAAKLAAKEAGVPYSAADVSKPVLVITAIIPIILLIAAAFLQNVVSFVCVAAFVLYAIFEVSKYEKAKSLGQDAKAEVIANAAFLGVCIGLAVACLKLFHTGFLA